MVWGHSSSPYIIPNGAGLYYWVFWLKYSIRLGIWIAIRVSVARKNCARLFVWFSWLPESMSCRKCRRNHAAWSWLCRKQAARRLLWRRSQAVRRWLWRSQAARRLLWWRSHARRWWWRRSQARRLSWRSQAMFRVGLQLDQRHNLWVAFLALSMNSSTVTYAAIVLGHAVVSAIYTSPTNNALFVDIIFVGGAWSSITTFDVWAADSNADIICSSGQILSLHGGKCYIRTCGRKRLLVLLRAFWWEDEVGERKGRGSGSRRRIRSRGREKKEAIGTYVTPCFFFFKHHLSQLVLAQLCGSGSPMRRRLRTVRKRQARLLSRPRPVADRTRKVNKKTKIHKKNQKEKEHTKQKKKKENKKEKK